VPGYAARDAGSGEWLYVYEVVDDGEVSRVGREEGHAMDVGSCGDREVDCSPARLSTTLGNRRRESPPLACHGRVDREGVERGLDDAESLRTQCPLVRVRRDWRSKVKLR
jgi:hypothetical protein